MACVYRYESRRCVLIATPSLARCSTLCSPSLALPVSSPVAASRKKRSQVLPLRGKLASATRCSPRRLTLVSRTRHWRRSKAEAALAAPGTLIEIAPISFIVPYSYWPHPRRAAARRVESYGVEQVLRFG